MSNNFNAPVEDGLAQSQQSNKDCRVYVGNLSYEVKHENLKTFFENDEEFKDQLQVAFAEVLITPNGLSKGCGIVEFNTPEQAQIAISKFSDKTLLGRPVFVREDREQEARFGSNPTPNRQKQRNNYNQRSNFNTYSAPGTQLFVGNLPFQIGWQDLKDLFRSAGNVVRADIQLFPDGRSKGNGIVSFSSVNDAKNAIELYNGYEYMGRNIEVREDKFANSPSNNFNKNNNNNNRFKNNNNFKPNYYNVQSAVPNPQIVAKNLPWSTSNEDLIELFETTGDVKKAEILYEPRTQRSRGVGIVEFYSTSAANVAIDKFNGYIYGGRPLEIGFSVRNHNFSTYAARKGN